MRKNKIILWLSLLLAMLLVQSSATAQKKRRKIATSDYQKTVEAAVHNTKTAYSLELPITIPLVFHVIHPKKKEALTREQIEWQVDALNRHFSLQEFNEKSIQQNNHPYHTLAVDTEIRFCLNKIFFTPSDSVSFSAFQTIKNDKTKGAKAFKPEENINIWVGKIADNSGFAQMPGGLWETDGIVIDTDYFGQAAAPYNEGKTLTHLIGNYLGLYNLWNDEPCIDDGVADTPLHNAENYENLNNSLSQCYSYVVWEMTMNFMDNTPDSLMYMFTQGQKERMLSILDIGGARNHLLQSACSKLHPTTPLATSRRKEIVVPDELAMKVYPNPPESDRIVIEIDSPEDQLAQIRLLNTMGGLEQQIDLTLHQGTNQYELHLPSKAQATYVLTLHAGEQQLVEKILSIR